MEDLSEEAIRRDCPHCNTKSQTYLDYIESIGNFHLVCDAHPLVDGHLMLIPKEHYACIGEYPITLFEEFLVLHKRMQAFIKTNYGSVATFEHGIFGQTVFHSHVHYLPFKGVALNIVPEGKDNLSQINSLDELKDFYKKDGGYLFFSINKDLFVVNKALAEPRFFRDRFAIAFGHPERSDWKSYHQNHDMMQEAKLINKKVIESWRQFKS